jgi:hypothetical protein
LAKKKENSSDSAMAIPLIEEISEVIQKYEELKQKETRLKAIAENGEDSEKAEAQLLKSQEFFTELRDTIVNQRPFYLPELSPSLRAKIADLRDRNICSNWAETHVRVMDEITQTYKELPISLLKQLRTVIIPGIWSQDTQEVTAGLTVGRLKDYVKIQESSKEYELAKQVRAETERVIYEVDLILCPYREFMQQEFGDRPVQSADAPISFDADIHRYKQIRRRLEVKARMEADEPRQGPLTQAKKKVAKPRTTGTVAQGSKKFHPWSKPGDACFIIDGARTLFHHDDVEKDLCLKSHSQTSDLLVMLQGGTLQSHDVKTKLCSEKTKPSQIVGRANQKLNDCIRKVGFTSLPDQNIEFIHYEARFDHYQRTLPIYASKDEFDQA